MGQFTITRGCQIKISNGHISATDHPIDIVFDSIVWFSSTADRMELLPVGPNPRWRLAAIWEISNDDISGTGYDYPINFMFYSRVGFWGTSEEWS